MPSFSQSKENSSMRKELKQFLCGNRDRIADYLLLTGFPLEWKPPEGTELFVYPVNFCIHRD